MKIKRHDTSRWVEYFKGIKLYSQVVFLSKYLRKIIVTTKDKGKILEVGAGSGLADIILRDYGFDVFAVDVDKGMTHYIKKAQERFQIHFPIIQADVFHLPFKDSTFDTVFSQGLMEHFADEDIVTGTREQGRVAEIVIMSVPSEKMLKPVYGDERQLSLREWKKLIKRSGLRIIKCYGAAIPPKYRLLWLLCPVGLWKIFGHYFTIEVGFICRKQK